MNVLLTCAGRRNYLLGYFRDAVGVGGKILAADTDPYAPAMLEADIALVVPPVNGPQYVDSLIESCAQHDVRLLCSLNDIELSILAANHERFAEVGTVVAVSSSSVIELCADKWRTFLLLQEWGVRTPATVRALADARRALSDGRLRFPLVVKPRWGTASIGIEIVDDAEDLESAFLHTERQVRQTIISGMSAADPQRAVLVQECLRGSEYGLDVINDLEGRHMATLAKRKLSMRAGETDRAVTVDDPELAALGAEIGARLGHVGNLDCDVFVGDGDPAVVELNPRFGGGYPFSHMAGANLPAALVAWADGRVADAKWLTASPGVISGKCDRLVVGAPIAPADR